MNGGNQMALSLVESLFDAVRWYTLKQWHHTAVSSARSEILKPTLSFFEVFRLPVDEVARTEAYRTVVESVVTRRHKLIKSSKDIYADRTQDPKGRILALRISLTMYDEVASYLTNGYFDESDAPPWDTWVSLIMCQFPLRGEDLEPVLLSWIPESDLEVAQAGIEGTPSDCLFWLTDVVGQAKTLACYLRF